MSQEQKRGCGFRKVGAMYLVGDYIPMECDRLPYKLDVCPVCGTGIKVGRGMTKINPLKLFGYHMVKHLVQISEDDAEEEYEPCPCHHPCFMCEPTEDTAYLMNVGERFYPKPVDFINEGIAMGFSKRIAQIPKEFEVGKTIVYLTHPRACQEPTKEGENGKLVEVEYTKGIFTVFIPQKVEKLYWQSELDNMTDKEKNTLERRGITPIPIKDGDVDHM